jgi:hypothetical protein
MMRLLTLVLLCGSCSSTTVDYLGASLRFEARLGDELWVNPDIEPVLTLVLQGSDGADEAWVSWPGGESPGRALADERFEVDIDLSDWQDGEYDLVSGGKGLGKSIGLNHLKLRINRQGRQHTNFYGVGTAQTPDLHDINGRLALTWTDRRDDLRRVYLQYLSAALMPLGEPIPLTPAGLTVARVEVLFDGQDRLGLLIQSLHGNGIRRNAVMVVDLEGQEAVAPIPFELEGENGRHGGSIGHDGEAFVAVARSFTDSTDVLRWMRFDDSGLRAGPIDVASNGDGAPVGQFLVFTPITVAASGDYSLVSFTRSHFDSRLDMTVQRNQVALLDRDGALIASDLLPTDLDFAFDQEVRVHSLHRQLIGLWTSTDLMSEEANPPHLLYGKRVDVSQPPSLWQPRLMIDAPFDRSEMLLAEDPNGFAFMIWQDLRFRAEDADLIRLMIAELSEELVLGEAKVLQHPRVLLGSSTPSSLLFEGRFVAAWVDQRHDGDGMVRSEIFLEQFSP